MVVKSPRLFKLLDWNCELRTVYTSKPPTWFWWSGFPTPTTVPQRQKRLPVFFRVGSQVCVISEIGLIRLLRGISSETDSRLRQFSSLTLSFGLRQRRLTFATIWDKVLLSCKERAADQNRSQRHLPPNGHLTRPRELSVTLSLRLKLLLLLDHGQMISFQIYKS